MNSTVAKIPETQALATTLLLGKLNPIMLAAVIIVEINVNA